MDHYQIQGQVPLFAVSAVTGQRDESGTKETLIVTTLFLNWMILDHLIRIMVSVDEKITSPLAECLV